MIDAVLSDDLIGEVLLRLHPSSSVAAAAASLVSKRWLRLLRSSTTFLTLRFPPDPPPHSSLSSFLSQHHRLSALHLLPSYLCTTTTTTLSDAVLLAVTSSCPNLTDLRLSTGPVSLFPILSLSASSPHLSSLSLHIRRPLFSLHFLSSFRSLKHLTLEFTGIPPADAPDSDYHPSSPAELPLETLRIWGIRPTDHVLRWLWSSCDGKTLKSLHLESCESLGDNPSFLQFLKGLVNIQELALMTCRSIVNLVLSQLVDSQCDSLKSLLIHNGGNKEGLLRFIRETRCDIKKLDFLLPMDLDNNLLIEIGVNFRNLSALILGGCYFDAREGLKSLVVAMGDNLEELGLPACGLIKKNRGFLVELAQNLPKLKKLDLAANEFLLDKEFIAMISSFSGLLEVNLSCNQGITDASLIALCLNCKQLRGVDIYNCWEIHQDGIDYLVVNCKHLKYLKVEEHKLTEVVKRRIRSKSIVLQ